MLQKVFDTWKLTDFYQQKIKMLWIFIIALGAINFLLWVGLMSVKSELHDQKLYITPAQVLQGGYYKTNTLSQAYVYGFAYQIFVALNTWSIDAVHDYKNNIQEYRYYLTPEYRDTLNQDYDSSLESQNLLDSVQTLAPYNETGYDPTVKQLNDNSWEVDLILRVTRYKDSAILMDALYDYKVRVVTTAQSIQYNPWGLAVAGIVSKTRLKTFV